MRNRLASASTSRSVLDRSRPLARAASSTGSLTPASNADRIARADLEYACEATEVSLIPASCMTFSNRWIARVRSCVIAVRSRVTSRKSRTGAGGTKLGRTRPCSTSWAIHTESATSVLRPGTLCRWVAAWDDHETENNYADLIDEIDDTGARFQPPAEFAMERAAAYQAYFEHMPIRAQLQPGSPALRIYRRFDFGRLARFNVLDTRQYRTDQPGGFSNDLGPAGPGRANVSGSLTGSAQEQWLADGLTSSPARWNVIAQQVMMSRTRFPNPTGGLPPTIVNLDQWDGYQPQRERLLRHLAERRVAK